MGKAFENLTWEKVTVGWIFKTFKRQVNVNMHSDRRLSFQADSQLCRLV